MGGHYPTAERVAKTLILAAMHHDELSQWVLRDELALSGRIELRSRALALAVLAALHPLADRAVLGQVVGAAAGRGLLADCRLAPWWSDRLVELVMVAVVRAEDGPAEIAFGGLTFTLTGLVRDRLSLILKGRRDAS